MVKVVPLHLHAVLVLCGAAPPQANGPILGTRDQVLPWDAVGPAVTLEPGPGLVLGMARHGGWRDATLRRCGRMWGDTLEERLWVGGMCFLGEGGATRGCV